MQSRRMLADLLMDHLVEYVYDSYVRGTVWTAGTAGIQVNLFPKECLSYIVGLGQ